jgi:hypothetical protein
MRQKRRSTRRRRSSGSYLYGRVCRLLVGYGQKPDCESANLPPFLPRILGVSRRRRPSRPGRQCMTRRGARTRRRNPGRIRATAACLGCRRRHKTLLRLERVQQPTVQHTAREQEKRSSSKSIASTDNVRTERPTRRRRRGHGSAARHACCLTQNCLPTDRAPKLKQARTRSRSSRRETSRVLYIRVDERDASDTAEAPAPPRSVPVRLSMMEPTTALLRTVVAPTASGWSPRPDEVRLL